MTTVGQVLLTGRTGVRPPPDGFYPDIPQFTLQALSDTEVQVTITDSGGASVFLVRQNNGFIVPLAASGVIAGLTPSTQYGIELQALNAENRPSAWSPIVLVTTQAALVIPSTISNLSGAPLHATVQLAFTDSVGAASHEYRVDGGAWVALAFDKIVTTSNGNAPLAAATEYDLEVRGVNVNGPGAASNLITVMTEAALVVFDPLSLLSPVHLERVLAEYPDAEIRATAVWGPTGIPPYADPVYDWGVIQADTNILDISDFGNDVATLLAAMETQGKDGKVGPGTYTVLNLITLGTRSLYGYGLTRPVIRGTWHHYIKGSNVKFQYIRRTNNTSVSLALAPFWLICIEYSHSSWFMTGNNYGIPFVRPPIVERYNQADVSNVSMLDCELDGVEFAFCTFFGHDRRIKNFRVGRNTYRNGCATIASIWAYNYGNGIPVSGTYTDDGSGIYIYQNDLKGAYHSRQASWAGTIIGAGGIGLSYGLTDSFGVKGSQLNIANGPLFINHNRGEDVVGSVLARRDENTSVCIHAQQTNHGDCRYNIWKNVWSPFFAVDDQSMYFKAGWVDFSENYIEGCGSSADNKFYPENTLGEAGGYQDTESFIADSAGPEAEVVLKGGGGAPTSGPYARSQLKRMIIIPRWADHPVFLPHHVCDIDEILVIGWRYTGYKRPNTAMIRASSVEAKVGPLNMFVDVGHDEFAGREADLVGNEGGSPGMTFNNLAVDFDGGAIACLERVPPIGGFPPGATNRAGAPLQSLDTNQSSRPRIKFEVRLRLSGSDLEIFNHSWFNTGVTETYYWLRDGVVIPGQTSTILPAAQVYGTIQAVVVASMGTAPNILTTKQITDPWYELGPNLVADPSNIVATVGASTIHNRALTAPLEAGEEYLVTFNNTQPVPASTGFIDDVSLQGGTVLPAVVVRLHASSKNGTWKYRYTAKAGDTSLRIIRGSKWVGTVSQIAVQKILKRSAAFATGKFVTFGDHFNYPHTQAWSAVVGCRVSTIPVDEGVLFSNITNATTQAGIKAFIGTGGTLRVRIGASASARIRVGGSINVVDGLPHVLGVTYDGLGLASGIRLFVDGVEDTNVVVMFDNLGGASITGGTHEFYLGNEKNSLTRFLPGSIDAFSLSDVERSRYWMEQHGSVYGVNPRIKGGTRFGLLGGMDSDVVLACDFNEAAGTTTADLSASGFNGTLSHSDMWTPQTAPPPQTVLVDLFLGDSIPADLSPPTFNTAPNAFAVLGGATGTPIANVRGVDENGAIVVLDSISLPDDNGTRFRVVNKVLEIGALSPDFEGEINTVVGGPTLTGVSYYYQVISGTIGAVTKTKEFKIGAKFPKIEPTGGAGGTVVRPTTDAAFFTALTGGAQSNVIVDLSEMPNAVVNRTTALAQTLRTNFTYFGNPGVHTMRGSSLGFKVTNGLIINGAFGPGFDVAGVARSNRDGLNLGASRRISVRNGSLSWSIDELCAITALGDQAPGRDIEFDRCAFFHPGVAAGHSTSEPSHALGLLIYNWNMNLVIRRSLFNGNVGRSPEFNGATRGLHVFNNIMANYQTGTAFSSASSATATLWPGTTAIIEANLYMPWPSNLGIPAGSRARTLVASTRATGAAADVYVPPPGDPYANHFFKFVGSTPDFTADPVDPLVHRTLQNGADQGAFKTWRPFQQVDDYGIISTATPEGRQAIFDQLQYVGCRLFTSDTDPTSSPIPGDDNAAWITREMLRIFRIDGSTRFYEQGGYTFTWPGDGTTYNLALDTVKDKFLVPMPPH